MRISDWSSDVCSSDLADHQVRRLVQRAVGPQYRETLAADAPADGVKRACALHPGLIRLAVGSCDRRNERFSDERVAIGIPAAQATMNARTKQAATGRSAGARARLTPPDRIVFEGRSEEHTSARQSLMR